MTAIAQPFNAQGVEFLSQLSPSAFNTPGPAPASGNDCWGYVSPSGREYALIGLENRLGVVEITDPRNPVIVGQVTHNASLWAGVRSYSNYAYVCNESGGGLQVVDLSNVDSGQVSLVGAFNPNGMTTSHTIATNPASGYLYMSGSNASGSGGAIVAVSLANPANPVYAGTWDGPYVHEVTVVSYTSGPYAGREIAFCCSQSDGLFIVDVTNKANMFTMRQVTYPGLQYCHQGWPSDDLRYFYINDELDGPGQGVVYPLTRVIDISSLEFASLVSTFSSPVTTSVDHNLYVRGRYIFEANYKSGIRIFDTQGAGTPTAPVEVAWLDTYPENDSNGYDGAWSTYPYFPSGTFLVSDISRGLFIARLNLDYLSFAFPFGHPARLQPGARTPIVVDVLESPDATDLDPASVTLHARVGDGAFSPIPMTDLGGGRFTANLPASECLTSVSYYVTAENTSGVEFETPAGGPDAPTTVSVYAAINSIASDNMEAERGWTAGQPGDTATTGLWERGDPVATSAQPEDDHSVPGVNCFVTGRTRGSGDGGNDVDGGFTTLLSPAYNLAAAGPNVRIGYWRWYSNSGGGAPNADVFTVQASSDNGGTWADVEVVGPGGPETGGGWIYHEFRAGDIVTPSAQTRLRFIAADLGAGSLVEACVDDLSIFAYDCVNVCPAVSQQPLAVSQPAGTTVQLSVSASATGALSYQWRKGNVPLADGGSISGATGPVLTIDPASVADSGEYDCLISAPCGSILSSLATVDIAPACDADVNCDGSPDQGDVACMILAVAGDTSCICQDADFNLDGSADQGDVAALIGVVAGQPCP